jgi:hypothetical protein
MGTAPDYSELRRRFTDQWIKIGDCPIRLCTQNCCIGLEELFESFGIRHEFPEEVAEFAPKSYRPTDRLISCLPESKVFDWKITFDVFNHLRQRKAWERKEPFEGYLEIPEMMGDILARMNWPDGFRRMSERLPSRDRSRLHQWFVQAFVDELFPDSLLQQLNPDHDLTQPTEADQDAAPAEWLEPAPDTLSTMFETLASEGIDRPDVPRWLAHQLREHGDRWAWGTEPAINPWAVYSLFDEVALFDEAEPKPIELMLSATQPDFWLAGQRGYGLNSYGFGIVSRVGPLFVAHQHGWGGVYEDAERATSMVNGGIGAWNSTLNAIAGSINESLRVAVVYSDYRNYAEIWIPGEAHSPHSSETRMTAPAGWTTFWTSGGENDVAELMELHHHDDIVIAIAAGHLESLIIDRQLDGQLE